MYDLPSSRVSNYTTALTERVKVALEQAEGALNEGNFRLVIDIAKNILSEDQQVPQAHYLIGRVAVETGEIKIAINALETAAKLDPSKSEYWAFLAVVYSQIGNMKKAEANVANALKIGSDDAWVLHPISHVLKELGQFDEAIKNLRKAVSLSPDEAIFHHALGQGLIETGDFKEAQVCLEKAVDLDPYDAKSWWVLSSLLKARDNNMAERLSAMMKEAEDYPMPKAYLGYAVGKLFEDTENWQKAFDAFQQGATAKQQMLDYDASDDKKVFEAIKKVCTPEWLAESVNEESSSAAPIFIIGQPRTGSTLVDRIISSHSKVHSTGEPFQLAKSLRKLSQTRTRQFISGELICNARNIKGKELANSYLSGISHILGDEPYFIDKLPMNFMLVGFISKAFPNAKFIHVTRNPADTCFSVFKQLFGEVYPHSYSPVEMAEHYVRYHQLMEYWHQVMPGKIYDIAYEDIVSDNVAEAKKLIAHLELEWEDDCANFERNQTAVVTASAAQVREKVHHRSVGRWKHYQQQLAPALAILEAAGIAPE